MAKMRVLIADDSRIIVDRLADLLKGIPGVEIVGQASDVQEAIRFVQQTRPDTLVLDLQMPGGSGFDVLRAIRQDFPSLRVVVCTNYSSPQYRLESIAAGANVFLDKSAEFEKLPVILRDWIREGRISRAAR